MKRFVLILMCLLMFACAEDNDTSDQDTATEDAEDTETVQPDAGGPPSDTDEPGG
jgi:hypothetical protein